MLQVGRLPRQAREPVDDVAQLADIAGVRVVQQERAQSPRHLDRAPLERFGGFVADELEQHRNLVPALAQRRQREMNDAEPIEQVLAEFPFFAQLAQVAVGGRDDARIHGDPLVGTDPLNLVRLQHAQQLHLPCQGQLADFVEEDGAGVRALEFALAIGRCAGECAPAMPEQLGLQQIVGNGPAVDGNERPVGPVPVGMDHLGHQLLAGAALAVDQHRQAGRCGLLRNLQRLEQLGVLAERAFEHETAIDQALAPLPPRERCARRLGGGCLHEALLVRQPHHFVAQRARLPQQLLDVRPFERRSPAQRRAQDLDLLEQPRVRDGRGGVQILVEDLHAALNCFCTSW